MGVAGEYRTSPRREMNRTRATRREQIGSIITLCALSVLMISALIATSIQ